VVAPLWLLGARVGGSPSSGSRVGVDGFASYVSSAGVGGSSIGDSSLVCSILITR
jgi:hypothetical protein